MDKVWTFNNHPMGEKEMTPSVKEPSAVEIAEAFDKWWSKAMTGGGSYSMEVPSYRDTFEAGARAAIRAAQAPEPEVDLGRVVTAARELREAQKAYMAVRDNKEIREPYGKAVAEAAERLDEALSLLPANKQE